MKSKNTTKKSEDLQGFHRYILKYPQNMNHTMHILVTYFKMTHIRDVMSRPNKYRSPLSSKTRKYTTCITFGSQHIYILKIERTIFTVLIEIHGFHNIAK